MLKADVVSLDQHTGRSFLLALLKVNRYHPIDIIGFLWYTRAYEAGGGKAAHTSFFDLL
jgi:hypothetical protein